MFEIQTTSDTSSNPQRSIVWELNVKISVNYTDPEDVLRYGAPTVTFPNYHLCGAPVVKLIL